MLSKKYPNNCLFYKYYSNLTLHSLNNALAIYAQMFVRRITDPKNEQHRVGNGKKAR